MTSAVDPSCAGVLVDLSPAPGLRVWFVFGFVLRSKVLGSVVFRSGVLEWDVLVWIVLV